MFGAGAGFIALTLLVFEPNLLAHGAYVTTDVALSCGLFATVYAFYRYVKAPSMWRLAATGLAADSPWRPSTRDFWYSPFWRCSRPWKCC